MNQLTKSLQAIFSFLLPGLDHDPVVQLETVLVVLGFAAALLLRDRGQVQARIVGGFIGRVAAHRRLAFIGLFIGTLCLHGLVSIGRPARQPAVHDEFAYLLAADTFLHGRLANPPLANWESFEAIHVNHRPTYSSKYPPAQGLLLAAGQLLGHYLAGPWIGAALLCSLLFWTISGWLPARWALLASLFAVFRIGVFSYWANSYWGGVPGALGGLLILGSVPRMRGTSAAGHAALAGVGVVILANSRPFEGLFLCGAAAALWLGITRRQVRPTRRWIWSLLCGMVPVLAVGSALTLAYNKAATGEYFQTAQQANIADYGQPILPWQSTHAMRTPVVPHHQRFYEAQRENFVEMRSPEGYVIARLIALRRFNAFFGGPLLLPVFPAICAVLKRPRVRFMVLALIVFSLAFLVNPWFFPHYFGPGIGLLYVLIALAIREIWHSRMGDLRFGRHFVLLLPLILLLVSSFNSFSWTESKGEIDTDFNPIWHRTYPGNVERAWIERQLSSIPGKHLVLVSYGPNHSPLDDWVYNGADLDNEGIIWAHDLDAARNQRLTAQFSDRTVWRINIDSVPVRVEEIGYGESFAR